MSANNQILIEYQNSKYFIIDKDIESNNDEGYLVGNAKTLEQAVKIANKYQEDNEVEYGLAIKLPKKKGGNIYAKNKNSKENKEN